MSFLRSDLASRSILSCRQANEPKDGKYVQAAGMVLVRQRPGSASGVVFITVEDETGVLNIIVWPKVFEQFRGAVLGSTLMLITGYLQREGEVVHLIARSIVDLSHELSSIGDMDELVDVRLSRADEFKYGAKGSDRRVQETPLQKARNFH